MRIVILLIVLLTGCVCFSQTIQQADILHQRGRELVNEGKITEGRECIQQALSLVEKHGEIYESLLNSFGSV